MLLEVGHNNRVNCNYVTGVIGGSGGVAKAEEDLAEGSTAAAAEEEYEVEEDEEDEDEI